MPFERLGNVYRSMRKNGKYYLASYKEVQKGTADTENPCTYKRTREGGKHNVQANVNEHYFDCHDGNGEQSFGDNWYVMSASSGGKRSSKKTRKSKRSSRKTLRRRR